MYVFDFQSDSLVYKYTNSDSLPFPPYYDLKTENRILYFTLENNLCFLDLNNKETYFYDPLFLRKEKFNSILLRGDTIFLGGDKGLTVLYTNKTRFTFDDSVIFESRTGYIKGDTILSLNISEDTLLIGTRYGLYKIEIDSISYKTPVLHSQISQGKIFSILKKDNKIFVSSDSLLYLYPDSIIIYFNFLIYSIDYRNDSIFVGTEKGLYLVYNNQKILLTPDSSLTFDIKVYRNKIYGAGESAYVYDLKEKRYKKLKMFFKELTSNHVSSLEKFRSYYIIGLRGGIDVFNEKYERVKKILNGWIRTIDASQDWIIAAKWCAGIFVIDSQFNTVDTLNQGDCIQCLRFRDDSTFFILRPDALIELKKINGDILYNIFISGWPMDIEKKDKYYITVTTNGDVFKINEDFSVENLMNIGTTIYDIAIFENDIFFATLTGIYYYELPDMNFKKKFVPPDPYTISITTDKYGNVYALSKSGLIFIDRERKDFKVFSPGPASLLNTATLDSRASESAGLLYYIENEEKLLIGTAEGFSIMDVKNFRPEEEPSFLIFPNPFKKEKGFFYIRSPYEVSKIFIISPSGIQKELSFLKLNNKYKINANEIERGFYILKVKTDKGFFTGKVVCE